jgi:hypothetical protein
MKNILTTLLFFGLSFNLLAEHFDKYCNSLFSFCIDIPGNFKRIGASKTGDGQYFTAKDGSTISVYGTSIDQNENLKQRFDREQAALTNDSSITNTTQLPTIEKAEMQENDYTIIYNSNGFTDMIYRKLENNTWKSLEFHYPTAKAKDYALKANKMIASFN